MLTHYTRFNNLMRSSIITFDHNTIIVPLSGRLHICCPITELMYYMKCL